MCALVLQIEQQKGELEKLDHAMGKKRTEFQFLTESVERKQAEINQLIRDTEAELSNNRRDIKVRGSHLDWCSEYGAVT